MELFKKKSAFRTPEEEEQFIRVARKMVRIINEQHNRIEALESENRRLRDMIKQLKGRKFEPIVPNSLAEGKAKIAQWKNKYGSVREEGDKGVVTRLIGEWGIISRRDLIKQSGISKSSLSYIVSELESDRLIQSMAFFPSQIVELTNLTEYKDTSKPCVCYVAWLINADNPKHDPDRWIPQALRLSWIEDSKGYLLRKCNELINSDKVGKPFILDVENYFSQVEALCKKEPLPKGYLDKLDEALSKLVQIIKV